MALLRQALAVMRHARGELNVSDARALLLPDGADLYRYLDSAARPQRVPNLQACVTSLILKLSVVESIAEPLSGAEG
jgi:hypothetical protein